MTHQTNTYQPDYATAPGVLLREYLETQGLSQAEFARRCGRSPKLISEILSAKAPILPRTALAFERVLGLDASIWLGLENDYRLHLARQEEHAARQHRGSGSRDAAPQTRRSVVEGHGRDNLVPGRTGP